MGTYTKYFAITNYNSSFVRVVQRSIKQSLVIVFKGITEDYLESLPDVAYDLTLEWIIKKGDFVL